VSSFADAIRSYSTFIKPAVIPAHDCCEAVSSFADAIRSYSTFIKPAVIPAHDCMDAGGRAMHGAIAEAGIQPICLPHISTKPLVSINKYHETRPCITAGLPPARE